MPDAPASGDSVPVDDAVTAFGEAVAAHQEGDLSAAIAGYRALLSQRPQHAGASVNLAAALRATGRLAEAEEVYRDALAFAPAVPELWFNYGNTLRDLGRVSDAIDAYQRALALRRDLPGAHFNLADQLHLTGQTAAAIVHWQAALELAPYHVPAWRRLIATAAADGQPPGAAEALLARALTAVPGDPWVVRRAAHSRRDAGDLAAAAELFRRLVELTPNEPFDHDNLGVVLAGVGDLDGAVDSLQRAHELAPDHPGILANLATLYTRRNQLDRAIPLYRRAVELDPNSADAATGLVKSLARGGACQEAVDVAQATVQVAVQAEVKAEVNHVTQQIDAKRVGERQPAAAECHQALGYALTLQGRTAEALDSFAAARRADPQHVLAHLNAAFTSLYSDGLSPEQVTALHRELAGAVEAHQPVGKRPAPADRDPARKLKIGYLSQDFRGHPVGHFIESALVHHDRAAVEVLVYADVATPDAVTVRQRGLDVVWRDVYGSSAEQLTSRIRADEVDILIELGGHTGSHAAVVMPRRPAPIQALYLGYPATSGVAAIDYVISDAIVSPPAAAPLYSETVMAIDGCFLCFRPYPDAPEVAPPPARLRQHVTFGCYNNLPKVSPRAVGLWAQVLRRVTGSRMVVKAPGLDDPPTRERLLQQFEHHGISRDRLALFGITTPLSRFLGEYARIDVALDSVPYGGGTTTCEALWMGVPVVTLAGRHFYERMGASISTHAGLPELVATSEDEYVRTATYLARDLPYLEELRHSLRERVRVSPLCDGPAYARSLEAAYRRMWRALVAPTSS